MAESFTDFLARMGNRPFTLGDVWSCTGIDDLKAVKLLRRAGIHCDRASGIWQREPTPPSAALPMRDRIMAVIGDDPMTSDAIARAIRAALPRVRQVLAEMAADGLLRVARQATTGRPKLYARVDGLAISLSAAGARE
jgi:hypothetical protein